MSIHKRSLRVGLLVAILCALLIAWRTESRSRYAAAAQADEDNWTTPAAARQGVRLLETRDPSGPPAYDVQPGDLLFFTNVGTSYAATNPKNSVVVFNAKTKQPLAVSDLDPAYTEKGVSHGIAVSPDGKYVYLPNIAPAGSANPSSVLVLDAQTLKLYQVISSGGPPHHVKEFQDAAGNQRMLIEDFNWWGLPWAGKGKGFYVLDPSDNNKVVAGMTPDDFLGMPYVGYTAPDGRYLYFSMPPPSFRDLLPFVDGSLAKIDIQTWQVVQYLPMHHYPLWTVFTQDGKWAWVTNSEDSKVLKIQRGTGAGPAARDKVVAEVPTGPGPYGLRMNINDKELWVADKGETLPGQRGTTLTVIDAEKNTVKRTIQTNCITNDHIILSPDGQEMWATCNQSHEIVVLDTATYAIKTRIPMPNDGDSHGGTFVIYWPNPASSTGKPPIVEVVSDQNGLQGSVKAFWANYFR